MLVRGVKAKMKGKLYFIGVIICMITMMTACGLEGSKAKAKQNRQQQIVDFKNSINKYAKGEISYDESLALSKGLVAEVGGELVQQLNHLQFSKNNYKKGQKAYKEGNYMDSYKAYSQVSDKDIAYYKLAMERMTAIEDKYIKRANSLVKGYDYDHATALLSELAAVSSNPDVVIAREDIEKNKEELVLYTGEVRNIFFHSLIVFTELAFDGDAMENGYNYWMTTVTEFKKMLEEMHKRDFILIDVNLLYDIEEINGQRKLIKKDLYLPKGKKPVILSLDDLNYYEYMEEDGFADRLVLDENGHVATLTKLPEGGNLIARDNDCVPILDVFVEEHPDFSFRGAKGVIGVTGYEGILGYRTDDPNSPTYEQDVKDAKAIVKRLKETGWRFASHSYGHINFAKKSLARVKQDSNKWDKEVGPLVGDTNLFIYPYGAAPKTGSPAFKELRKHGFDVFFGVCAYTELRFVGGGLLMDRCNLDGYRMNKAPYQMKDLFSVDDIIDSSRPTLQ